MNLDSTTPLFSSRIRQAAGLAAGVALASSATAAITNIDIDVPINSGAAVGFNPFAGIATTDSWHLEPLYMYNSGGNYYMFASPGNYDWAVADYSLVNFAFNEVIDSSTPFYSNSFMEFTTEGSIYFGFRYDDEGSYYYGWLHGTFSTTTGFHFDQMALNSTAGQAVYAGIDPAIPEPATSALLFGVVAAGLMFWRRCQRSRLPSAA